MGKRKARTFILFILFLLVILLTSCGVYTPKNHKADDDMSKAIYEKIGEKAYYLGKENHNEDEIWYHYVIHDSKDENLLADIVTTVNNNLEENNVEDKIVVFVWEVVPGGRVQIARLYNYYEEADDFQQQYLCYLIIMGNEVSSYSSYNQISVYTNLNGIEYLEVVEKINQSAEEEGIDWYEVFPDLKSFEVLSR